MKINVFTSERIPPPVRTIVIDGVQWDLHEIMTELDQISEGNYYLYNDTYSQKLLELRVVKSLGSSYGSSPQKGENWEEFYSTIYNLYKDDINTNLEMELPEDRKPPKFVKYNDKFMRDHVTFLYTEKVIDYDI